MPQVGHLYFHNGQNGCHGKKFLIVFSVHVSEIECQLMPSVCPPTGGQNSQVGYFSRKESLISVVFSVQSENVKIVD